MAGRIARDLNEGGARRRRSTWRGKKRRRFPLAAGGSAVAIFLA
jgi:hypothetical protein